MKDIQTTSDLKVKALAIYAYLYSSKRDKEGKTMLDIITDLGKMGISCDKRILDGEIMQLNRFLYRLKNGTDNNFSEESDDNVIVRKVGARNKYTYHFNGNSSYVPDFGKSTDIDTGELRFLYDAVLSADFMTEEMVNGLCEKIKDTAANDSENYFIKHTDFNGRNRYHTNGNVLLWADELCKVISENKNVMNGKEDDEDDDEADDDESGVNKPKVLTTVTFEYGNLNSCGVLEYKATHTVLPIALVFNKGYYYIVSLIVDSDELHPFRLDRIMSIQRQTLPLKKLTSAQKSKIDEYNTRDNQVLLTGVSMWDGPSMNIILKFKKKLIGDIFDRYGKNVVIKESEDDWYTADVRDTSVNALIAWVFQFDADMQILAPTSLIEKYKETLNKVIALYP